MRVTPRSIRVRCMSPIYVSLDRIILYVQDVERLTKFTKKIFELPSM
jgi:hypothetical protein